MLFNRKEIKTHICVWTALQVALHVNYRINLSLVHHVLQVLSNKKLFALQDVDLINIQKFQNPFRMVSNATLATYLVKLAQEQQTKIVHLAPKDTRIIPLHYYVRSRVLRIFIYYKNQRYRLRIRSIRCTHDLIGL